MAEDETAAAPQDTPAPAARATRKTPEQAAPAQEPAAVSQAVPGALLRFTGHEPTIFFDLGGQVLPDQEIRVADEEKAQALLARGDFQRVESEADLS